MRKVELGLPEFLRQRDKMEKKFDKIKIFKKFSREDNSEYGKSGPHVDKKEKRKRKLTTKDYLRELEEEWEEEVEEKEKEEESYD